MNIDIFHNYVQVIINLDIKLVPPGVCRLQMQPTIHQSLFIVMGDRRMALAFSLWRIRPRDFSKRVAVVEFCSPVRTDLYLASSLHTAFAVGPQPPPSASHIRGIKFKPSSRQVSFGQVGAFKIFICCNHCQTILC